MARNTITKSEREQRILQATEYVTYFMFKGNGYEARMMSLFSCENSIVRHVIIMKFELERMKERLNPRYKVYLFLEMVLNDLNGRLMYPRLTQ